MISLIHLLNEAHIDIADYNIKYHKSGKEFTVEMSEIRNALKYHNDMKEPITLWNSKTGKSMVFKFIKLDYSGPSHEKEITGWEYKSKEGIKLVIFND